MNPTNTIHAPTNQTIPPDFFAANRKHDPQKELSYSVNRQKLHTSLRIPANNRWVADWLFLDTDTPFHRNITIPPEAFLNSVSVQVLHHFVDFQTPSCPFSQIRPPSLPSPPTSLFHSKGAEMLLLPVASTDGITVGYAFGTLLSDTPSQTRNNAFGGRFTFDPSREELLVISRGDQPGSPLQAENQMVIMSFMWTPDAVRQHYMFLCPLRDYSYFNLPNEVVFFASAEKRLSSKSQHIKDTQALPNLFVDTASHDFIEELLNSSSATELSPHGSTVSQDHLAELFELPPASSEFPWFLDSTGNPADNVGIPRCPGDVPTSSGAFNMTNLSESLTAIELSLQGDFYGSRQDMDLIQPQALADHVKSSTMSTARDVIARISRADASQSASLRHFAVHMYLSDVLPVISNEQFVVQSKPANLLAAVDNGSSQPLQASAQVRRIAPLPIASSSGETEEQSDPKDEEERRRQDKHEAKRRRNRLSAARSNAKRKEAREMQQRTLESLRDRVQELKARKLALAVENKLLREQLTTGFE